jgi:histone deacetylase 1/2
MAQPWDDIWEIQDYEIQTAMADPIAFAASSNPDTMYMHEALKAPDRAEFIKAMQQEVRDHEERGHWELISKSEVPKGTIILPAVWSMKRKRRITTNEVYKWKARLNVHGGKQVKNVHYWETYSPVVKWSSIRLFLMIAAIKKWHTRQIDFVLAYPHADIETDMYMELPRGFESQGPKGTQCLKLKKNLYGQKQAGRVWNKFLHKGLTDIGFEQSKVDECVYYRGTSILLCYVDDTILIDPSNKEIDKIIQQLKEHKFDVQDEGQIEDFLGVRIRHNKNGTIEMSQPHLIQQILQDLNLAQPVGATTKTLKYAPKTLDIPAPSTIILERDPDGEPHEESWHYRSIIGKLNYLEKSSRPDLAYSVHNCARFSSNPKATHSQAVKRIGRYLLGTKDKGITFKPDPTRSLEVFADSDFCGLYNPETALYDPVTSKSRTGFIIRFMGCPIVWASTLQTETALSTCEAEYISCSEALRSAIPLIHLIEEIKSRGITTTTGKAKVLCKLFCDNQGACELIRLPKIRPRTKHINTKLHHFRDHVANGSITIQYVPTGEQIADIATKPLSHPLFSKFRASILGW